MRNKWSDSRQCLAQILHSVNMTHVPGLIAIAVGGSQRNESLVCKGSATIGLWNILYPELNMPWFDFVEGRKQHITQKSQYFILKSWFQPYFYSFPRMPSGSHWRGSWFKPDPKKGLSWWSTQWYDSESARSGWWPRVSTGRETMGDFRT